MAGMRIAQRQNLNRNNNLRPNFQNQNFQQQNGLQRGPQNTQGVQKPNELGETKGANETQDILKKLEELLTKFMETMQAQKEGCEGCGGGAPAGGGAPQGAGGAQGAGQKGANDPMMTLEELLKQLRELAQKNPQALQQFLQQNPQLAQMLGAQLGNMGGGAAGGGVPAMEGPGLQL